MKKTGLYRLIFLLAISVLVLLPACKDDVYEYGEFTVNLATCTLVDGTVTLRLDDGSLLIPDKALNSEKYSQDKRVIVNYVFTHREHNPSSPGREIGIKAISVIFSDSLRTATSAQLQTLPDDPVYLESVWIEGGYLNFRLQIERNHTIHKLILLANADYPIQNGILNVELRHDRQEDTPGYNTRLYASFKILGQLNGISEISIKINAINYPQKQFTITLPQNKQ